MVPVKSVSAEEREVNKNLVLMTIDGRRACHKYISPNGYLYVLVRTTKYCSFNTR